MELRPSGVLLALALASTLPGCDDGSGVSETASENAAEPLAPIGPVDIRTAPFDPGLFVRSATYTPSGRVLVTYADEERASERTISLATMNDDGTAVRTFYEGTLPERPQDNGVRFMVFPDNERIFLGDFVLECAAPLEECREPALLPVAYPAEIAAGDHIMFRWSEMIIAPDNRSVAWTTLLANLAAVVFTGKLERNDDGYVIEDAQIVSSIDPFVPDPQHSDGVIPEPVRGGEVKQFVDGGRAMSSVAIGRRELPDSVIQHLRSGEMEAVTDTPSYTETTILSPDERLGITMTTAFSPRTNLAVLGLVPRPYPDSLNMGLNMFAYTYGVTGVRRERAGNIGPALIDLAESRDGDGFSAINLNADPDWVYRSPMSWHPDGTKAMWLERRREGGSRRIRIVELPQYTPRAGVAAAQTPVDIPYAIADLSVVKDYATKGHDVDVKVYGRHSGYIEYRRTPRKIVKSYVDFSDDGASVFSGMETTSANPSGTSTYAADLTLSGSVSGRMDLQITFGPLGGELPARIIFEQGEDGQPQSYGFAEYGDQRLEVSNLLP